MTEPAPEQQSRPTRLVIYHADCADGFAAAWACSRVFGTGPDVDYHAAKYGAPPPDVAGLEVVVVDFSYPRAQLLEMHAAARSLFVYDHHKTAEADLAGLPFAKFDMDRSGAGLAWDCLVGTPRRWLIDYVEDRDLWRFRLPNSRAVNAALSLEARTFQRWNDLLHDDYPPLVPIGEAVLKSTAEYVRSIAREARRVAIGGVDVPCVNAPYTHVSELLHELAKGEPFAVAWFQQSDGRFKYSLRSEEGGADVSAVAASFPGGGGHQHAAGFTSGSPPWTVGGLP